MVKWLVVMADGLVLVSDAGGCEVEASGRSW